MATIIYQCMLDPNFTGNTIENPYQLVNFFDVNITSNEIIIIKNIIIMKLLILRKKNMRII